MLLFLDLDGVLHPHIGYRPELLMCRLPILEDVLRASPSVEVVISSTWRMTRTLDELKSLFSLDIGPRIIGKTPNWRDIHEDMTYGTFQREAEIRAWLHAAGRAWESWIALDDQPSLYRPFCKNLILTNSATGLTQDDCELLTKRLSSSQS